MPFSRSFAPKIVLFLVTLGLICVPASAGTLVADVNPVVISYVLGNPAPEGTLVNIKNASGNPVTITATLNPNATNPTSGLPIFVAQASGSAVVVGLNASALPGLASQEYNATLKISANAGADTLDLPIKLLMGTSVQLTANPGTLAFAAALGDTNLIQQTITVTSTVQVNFSASVTMDSGSNWMNVTPVSGVATSVGQQVTLTISPTGLPAGNYTGSVKFSPSGQSTGAVTVQVSLAIGGSGGLFVNPTSLSFNYNTASGIPPAQTLAISSSTANTYAASAATQSGATWLLVGGGTYVTGYNSSGVVVSVNPTGLANGIHYGTVTVMSGSQSLSVPVTLSVNSASSGVTINPGSLAMSAAVGGSVQALPFSLSTTSSGITYTATTSSTGGWLYLSSTSGAVSTSTTIYAYANPIGLYAGTHYGYITLTYGGTGSGTATIPVSLTVGGSGGGGGGVFGVAPTALNFAMERAKTDTLPYQSIGVSGVAGTGFSVTGGTTSGGSWLTVSPASALIPANVSVGIIPSVASTLAAGTYDGTVSIMSNTGTVSVSVRLTVSASPVLIADPGAITVNYDPASPTSAVQYMNLRTSSAVSSGVTYQASSSVPWITFPTVSSGSVPVSGTAVPVVLAYGSLAAGINTGTITITATNVANTQVSVPVSVIVTGTTSSVTFSPTAVSFSAPVGTVPADQTVTVNSTTSTNYSVSYSSQGNWLSIVSSTSGTVGPGSPASLVLKANSASLPAGNYSGTVTVNAGGVSQTLNVTLSVGGTVSGTLVVENLTLSFDYQQGAAAPGVQGLPVTSVGGMLNFTASAATTSGGNWLTVSPSQGATPTTLSVGVNAQVAQNLAPGSYAGTVTVTAPGASGSPQTRNVTLTVRAAAALGASPASLSFTYRTDGAVPAAQSLNVTSTGAALAFNATSSATWLTVKPATGTTPATLNVTVNPAGLNPGTHNAQITLATTTATPASNVVVNVTLTITAQLPTINSITNAASYVARAVSPGEIVTFFGTTLGPSELTTLKLDSAGRVASSLAEVRVMFSGVPAPLVYVSATQVSAIVPYAVAGKLSTPVWLEYRGVRSNSMNMEVAPTAPAIFTANASGTGPGAILNQDYGLNSSANPAAKGSVVMIYVTGEGQTLPAGTDGMVAGNDPSQLCKPVLPVTVTIDGQPANVVYAGAAPGMVSGLMQVNVEIPAGASSGAVPVVATIGNSTSQPGVTVAVR